MLRWRLILGTAITVSLAGLCWADMQAARPGIFLLPLAIVIAWLATGEILTILRTSGSKPRAGFTHLATLLPILAACAPIAYRLYPPDCPVGRLGWLACGLAAGLLVVFVGEMLRYEQPGSTANNLAASALAVLYVGGLLGFLIQLRLLPSGAESGEHRGMVALLSMILAVKLSDTCQFTVGNLWGKHKLAPALSPGKTWEGAVGGIGLSLVISSLLLVPLLAKLGIVVSTVRVMGYCGAVCVAGIFGDLAESMLKRDAGVKDSSTWIPGLGGVLDLLDSLLFAAPVAYFCWASGLLNT